MTKAQTLVVNLPFDGFYDSLYSSAIDHEESMHIENRVNESDHDDDEHKFPEPLRLTEDDHGQILYQVTTYGIAYRQLARDYVAAFDYVAGQAFGLQTKAKRNRYDFDKKSMVSETYMRDSIRATFESMDSPREYNFATDRVYAEIPLAVMRDLLRRSKAEKHVTLSAVIRERFTSRDGFISGYSNDLADWLENPLQDWDHNELGTLLIAAMRAAGQDPDDSSVRHELYDSTVGDEGAYKAWESAVDWTAYDSKVAESRAEKFAEWIADDKESAITWTVNHPDKFAALLAADSSIAIDPAEFPQAPYRCPVTPDLFPNTLQN